jgi:hypothetical protein
MRNDNFFNTLPWRYGLLLLLLSLLFEVESSWWLFPPVTTLSLIGLPLTLLFYPLCSTIVKRYLLTTALVMLMLLTGQSSIENAQYDTSKIRAEHIIQQLEAYKHQVGHYPDSLKQLTPHYLAEVPKTGFGLLLPQAFSYLLEAPNSTSTPSNFRLVYTLGSMVDATYSSRTQSWHVDD